jgi:bla regulator protein blaR1
MSGEAFQTWAFDSLLVTTLLMVAVLLLRRPVAKAFGASVAYALWLIPAARLLMPSIESSAAPVADNGQAIRDAVREAMLAGVPASEPAAATTAAAVAVPGIDWAALGVTFWLGGAALFFIIQMIRYAAMRDDLLSGADELATIDGVKVVSSDQVAGPLAFGLFKRYVAVPKDFSRTYSPAMRELALAHEMAHHRSGDLFANLVAFVILCLQWFNPVAWMSWNAFRFDQEAACDARVLAGKGSEERAIYGQALARTAFDGVPTFATALNSPKTIIERLRRLSMKDATAKRRLLGKLGILTAAAIILPATATIVPAVIAQDAPAAPTAPQAPEAPDAPTAPEAPKVVKKVKIIKIGKDGENVTVIGGEGKNVRKVERDGKTFVFHGDKEYTDAELDRIAADAEKHAAEAEKWVEKTEALREGADEARRSAMIARRVAEGQRVRAIAMAPMYIPEIDIREIRKGCKEGQPVTTDVRGFDGQHKSSIKLVMCGKGQAKIARASAIEGLRDARRDVSSDEDIPESVRKEVVDKLDEQIRKLQAQADDS